MNYNESIEQTKKGFEESFQNGTYYNKKTMDNAHLKLILECIDVKSGMRILDLGTGSGIYKYRCSNWINTSYRCNLTFYFIWWLITCNINVYDGYYSKYNEKY